MNHLTHDIGWPTLVLCAFVLGLILPGLIAYARFEIRLYSRARRWKAAGTQPAATPAPLLPVEVDDDPVALNAAWGFDRLAAAMHEPTGNVVDLHQHSRRVS